MDRLGSCMNALLRVLAGVLVVIVIVALPITLLAHNAASVLFSPQSVTRVLTSELVDSGLLRRYVIDQLLTSGAEASGAPSLAGATRYLTADQRDAIAKQLVPDSWVKEQISTLANDLYSWIDSTDPSPDLQVDVRPMRESLASHSAPIVQVIVSSWPACSLADLGRLATAVFGSEEFPYCQPPEPLRSALVNTATAAVQELSRTLPESLSLGPALAMIDPAQAEQTKSQLRLIRFVMRWSWILPLATLGLIMALAVRTWRGLLRWWGIPLLGGGLVSFLPVVVGPGITREYLQAWALRAEAPAFLTDALRTIGSGLVSAILRLQAIQALAVSVAGGLLVIASLILKAKPAAVASGTVTTSATQVATPQAPPRVPSDSGDHPSGMFG